MSAPDPVTVVAGLLRAAGLGAAAMSDIELTGTEPVLPSSFAIGTAAQATIAAAALAAADLWRRRIGRRQRVSVAMRNAAIEFRSERYLRIDGKPPLLDLREKTARETLAALVRDADDFVQGYRPGAIAAFGFGPHDVARMRPGIVYVSLCAYGHEGPWAARRGFDSLVQTASGFNVAEADAFGESKPRPLPAQALDHATGYLLAFAAMAALARRAERGGSWHVQASLAQTGYWLRQLGRIDGARCPDPGFDEVGDCLEDTASGFGRLTAVRHAAVMAATPPRWVRPTVPLGSHPPAWP